VIRPDDSSLNPRQLRKVENRARKLLDRASAWDRFPTPVEDILAAAKLDLTRHSIFDPDAIISYIQGKAAKAINNLKSAISKVLGIYDANDRNIHIDDKVTKGKQNFLKLHETGHHEIETHRIYRLFQDCEKTLDPEIADLFEREANNFARFTLFQGDCYGRLAADCEFSIKTPIKLAQKFGASIYSSAREFARKNHRSCVVYVLEPIEYIFGSGARALVRRIEPSPSFEEQFGCPEDSVITLDHPLGTVLPIGRKMTRPVSLTMTDRNGDQHECIAEAFDTTWNVLILLYPIRSLTSSKIILMPGLAKVSPLS